MSRFKQPTTKAILIATTSLALAACGSQPQRVLYDDASKMNRIEISMNVDQVQAILGNPRTSLANADGFRCAEYGLLKKSSNYVNTSPDTFYVMFYRGRTVATGERYCSSEMHESNFKQDPKYPGKYARFMKQ